MISFCNPVKPANIILLLSWLLISGCSVTGNPLSGESTTTVASTNIHHVDASSDASTSANQPLSALQLSIIRQHNLLRANPSGYADRFLVPLLSRYQGKYFYDAELTPGVDRVITQEGVSAVHEAIRALRRQQPIPIMQPSRALTLSAEDHARDQASGRTGHIGSDGSTLLTRIKRRADNLHAVAENIAYGQATARRIINALLIDDGVADRGHREAMLSPEYRWVGVATMPHQKYGIVTVLHYADQVNDSPDERRR